MNHGHILSQCRRGCREWAAGQLFRV